MLETNPDSTLMLIDSVMRMEANLRESERMEMALLQGHALYGGSICDDKERPMLDKVVTLPELDIASDYYAERKEYGKAMLTAYYSGHSLLEAGDKASAMESFKKAEQYGNIVGDSLTVARAQYQMGKMLFDDFMEAESIVVLKNADSKFGDHEDERAFVKNLEAIAYIMTQKYDSAELLLNQGLECAEKGKSIHAKQKVLNNYAVFYRLQGNFEKALGCIEQVRALARDQESELLLFHLNIGNIFNEMKELDSASFHYNKMEEMLVSDSNVRDKTKVAAYGALSRFAEQQGDYQMALELRKKYDHYLYSVEVEVEKKKTYWIQKRYDYEVVMNLMNKERTKKQYIYIALSLIFVLLLLALTISFIRLAKKRKTELENNQRILAYVKQLTDAWTKEENTMSKVAIYLDNRSDKASLEELRRVVFGKQDPWEAMVMVFDKIYPDKRSEIVAKYGTFTEIEQKHILLSYFKVSRQEEALLLKTSIHTVDKIRNSVNKKMANHSAIDVS